jgi:hypothetical protein
MLWSIECGSHSINLKGVKYSDTGSMVKREDNINLTTDTCFIGVNWIEVY